jgi:5-methylthioadenosine/S-adenosylhomocysteine deaminase
MTARHIWEVAMAERCDTLLLNGTVVTMDARQRVISDGAVAITGNQIVAVGPSAALVAAYVPRQAIDCLGCAIIPGLINGHAHVPMTLLRGVAADMQLDVWLFGYMFPLEQRFCDARFVATGARLACAEMLRGGVTTFVDMYYFEDEVARAAADAGMRAICGQAVMRLPTPDAASLDEGLARARRFIADWHGHERITPTIAPHAPYTCTDEIYHEAAALCRQYGIPLLTHLSETAREVQESRAERQQTPIAYARDVGAFGVHCIAAHCVHATDEDMRIMQQHGVGVVTCPGSNLKLASGLPPIRAFLDAGLRLGLGTDGPASNDDQDMFGEMLLAAIVPKAASADPTVVPARQAFALATSSGAGAIGMAHLIGSLEVGKRADVTVVEIGRAHSTPRYRYDPDAIYSTLVYAARAADVRDVFVDGRAVVRDRTVMTLDEAAVLRDAQAIADRIDQFLIEREADLLDKVIVIAGVRSDEQFEVQAKARLATPAAVERVLAALHDPAITLGKVSERTQYDTFFLWDDATLGRIRIREDRRTDPGARPTPKYTLTLTGALRRHAGHPALIVGHARYTAVADQPIRFYREYFAPDRVVEVQKQRRRWRIRFRGEDLAVNLDQLLGRDDPATYLEIKSRTWSARDAAVKAQLITELLAQFGIDEQTLVNREYVDL